MTDKLRACVVLASHCPNCGARPAEPCQSKNGEARKSFHRERHSKAKNQTLGQRQEIATKFKDVIGFVVYSISDPTTGQPFYVGQTADLYRRILSHLRSGESPTANRPVRRRMHDLIRRGLQPNFQLLERYTDEQSSLQGETFWVMKLAQDGAPLVNNWSAHLSLIKEAANRRG